MVDVLSENFLSIDQITKLLPPGRNGKPVNFSTVFRWITVGVKSVNGDRTLLEATRLGGRWLVSREALQRFTEALTVKIHHCSICNSKLSATSHYKNSKFYCANCYLTKKELK